jgi:hypothetical protein
MTRSAVLAAFVLFAFGGDVSAQYRQPVTYRPTVNYNGGGWYAGGYPGGRVGGIRYVAPIYAGAPQTYYNGIPANYSGGYGYSPAPVYRPYRFNPGVPTYRRSNYGFRYGY